MWFLCNIYHAYEATQILRNTLHYHSKGPITPRLLTIKTTTIMSWQLLERLVW